MRELVSIVIPIYNGSQYLDNIFYQINKQTYKNIELVFVDDGSTDDSYNKILFKYNDSWSKKICSIKVLRQENMGQGAARNKGLKNVSGKYIAFMDQDDSIESTYIEILLKKAIETDADIVISGYNHKYANGDIKERVVLTNDEWCKYMNITPWGKLYKEKFIRDNSIEFLPTPFGEDIYFNILCFSKTNKIYHSKYVGYNWLLNTHSVSNTIHKRLENADVITLYNELIKIPHSEGIDQYYRYFLIKTAIYHILYVSKSTKYKELIAYRDRIMEWLREYVPDFDNNRQISIIRPHGERFIIRFVVKMYMMLYKIHMDSAFLRIISKK